MCINKFFGKMQTVLEEFNFHIRWWLFIIISICYGNFYLKYFSCFLKNLKNCNFIFNMLMDLLKGIVWFNITYIMNNFHIDKIHLYTEICLASLCSLIWVSLKTVQRFWVSVCTASHHTSDLSIELNDHI